MMRTRFLLGGIALLTMSVWLSGCRQADRAAPAVSVNGHIFRVEIATTDAQRAVGLSNRRSIPADGGMLFVFDRPQRLAFHMLDCYTPIDIAFLDDQRRIINLMTMAVEPDPADPQATYPSEGPAKYALEVAGGTWQRIAAEPGMVVEFHDVHPR